MEYKNLAELKNASLNFDSAEYRNVKVDDKKEFRDDYTAIWNITQDSLICIKPKTNKCLLQHKDLVQEFCNVSTSLGLSFKGFVKDNDRDSIQLVAWLNKDVIDTVKLGIIINNNYKSGSRIGVYGFRSACQNGMVLTSVLHKKFSVEKIEELPEVLKSCINIMVNENNTVKKIINEAMEDSIENKYAMQ